MIGLENYKITTKKNFSQNYNVLRGIGDAMIQSLIIASSKTSAGDVLQVIQH